MRYDGLYVVTREETKCTKLGGDLYSVLNGYDHESADNQYKKANKGRCGAVQAD